MPTAERPMYGGMVGVRKLLALSLLFALVLSGLTSWSSAASAADTGAPAPQTGKIVSDEPGTNAPNILDGTVYSIAKVGNTIVVGGQFTQAQNYNTSTTVTRNNVLAFDATTGRLVSSFAPDPNGTVYKVLPAADGQSVYVAGAFSSAAGQAMPGRLFKINVTTGAVDPSFTAQTISGDIRDLELVGNHLFLGGKFTHINGIAQRALGTVYADTGRRDPYFNAVFTGTHNANAGATTNVAAALDQQAEHPARRGRQLHHGRRPGAPPDREVQRRQHPDRRGHDRPPDAVALDDEHVHAGVLRLLRHLHDRRRSTHRTAPSSSSRRPVPTAATPPAWPAPPAATSSPGSRTTPRRPRRPPGRRTPAVTPPGRSRSPTERVYVGGHQRWQNNPTAGDTPGQGAVSREGIAALDTVNGLPYSWNPTRARGVGVEDMLATPEGLYVGSDTELLGHTAGNTYHARIGVLPLAGGTAAPQLQTTSLPVDLYRVATSASQLTRRSFTGTTIGTVANAPTGPGWGTSTGAFMVNGVLYKTNADGSLSKMTFDGTTYGTVSPVNTGDALTNQSDWHTDARTIQNLFYSGGYIYYSKIGHERALPSRLQRRERGHRAAAVLHDLDRHRLHQRAWRLRRQREALLRHGRGQPVVDDLEPGRARPGEQHERADHHRRQRLVLAGDVPLPRGLSGSAERAAGGGRGGHLRPARLHLQRHQLHGPRERPADLRLGLR